MLATRLLTAGMLAAALFAAVSFSDHVAIKVLFFAAFAAIAGIEFVALRWRFIEGPGELIVPRPHISREHTMIGLFYGLTIPVLALGDRLVHTRVESGLAFAFIWSILCSIFLSIWLYITERNLSFATSKLINGMAGFVYISIPAIALYRMSEARIPGAPDGIGVYFCLAVVLMGDSTAYFGGRLMGGRFFGRKLLPRISPKKTLEGSIFGLIGSGLTGTILAWYYDFHVPYVFVFAVCTVAGAAGQIGDLLESALKRVANVKDSSGLLPGHGGALDRVDAVLLGAPLCNLIFFFNDLFLSNG